MTVFKSVRPSISKALILTDDDFRLWCMVGGKCLSLLSDYVADTSWSVLGDVACMSCRVVLCCVECLCGGAVLVPFGMCCFFLSLK